MSNVLIGIIGVVLFIGLALAGALFLGPRFQEATQSSKAATVGQVMTQYMQAITMYNMDNVTTPLRANQPPGWVTGFGYLKSTPTNPLTGALDLFVTDSAGAINATDAKILFMPIPYADEAVCRAIARASGQPDSDAASSGGVAAVPAQSSGCFRASAGIGTTIANGQYHAYVRI